ncbi:hypothetical protein BDU57DRAFT_326362 [Ampelomyces quisqualis]|uniref:Uncharacterized protein n=1 Tax=Ampelomyces quisqualis TaxID=50730 RepID=A0A6A5QGD9_AMPQU|nr:hypothetical protein BDU57DRAFT_326362 [Ampelomyces quisqualis]
MVYLRHSERKSQSRSKKTFGALLAWMRLIGALSANRLSCLKLEALGCGFLFILSELCIGISTVGAVFDGKIGGRRHPAPTTGTSARAHQISTFVRCLHRQPLRIVIHTNG